MHEARIVAAGDERRRRTPPTMAMSEFNADQSGDRLEPLRAHITLKPNQPTMRIQAPRARKGMLDGGCADMPPSRL